MAPSWVPITMAMARYCEPFFAALERWRQYDKKNLKLIENRLQMLCLINKIFTELCSDPDSYIFSLDTEYDIELLPEVFPTAGVDFVTGNDKLAFHAAKDKIPPEIFKNGGWFFQNNLLKGLAGFDDDYLASANRMTRESTIKALEKLFRIQESSGFASISYHRSSNSTIHVMPTLELNELAVKLYNQLLSYTESISIIPGNNITKDEYELIVNKKTKSTTKKTTNLKNNDHKKPTKEVKEVKAKVKVEPVDEIPWTTNHRSVGTKVASYFYNLDDLAKLTDYHIDRLPDPNNPFPNGRNKSMKLPKREIFFGIISKYAPPSSPNENDELYHVEWEDGDSQDFNENELIDAKERYETIVYAWSTDHIHIGKSIAVKVNNRSSSDSITDSSSSSNKKMKLSSYKVGTITEYTPENKYVSHSFKVKFEDNTEDILTLAEVERGLVLFDEINTNT